MRYVLRFYGSCDHVTDEDISAEEFARWAGPTRVQPLFGPEVEHVNEQTVEGDAQVVHVHPFRFMICANCAAEVVDAFGEAA